MSLPRRPLWVQRLLWRSFLQHLQHLLIVAGIASILLPAMASVPGNSPSNLCEEAARRAADQSGVPLRVLRAIMLTETGRRTAEGMEAWPWAINQGGAGHWFDTRRGAVDHVTALLATGQRNIDLGCFQVNLRWHGQAFASLDAMIDPQTNADYAAALLARLYADRGDWSVTAGAYHSATEDLAERYRGRFDTVLATLQGGAPTADAARADTVPERVNRFPLLQAGGQGQGGSLFPSPPAGQPLFGG